MKKTLVSKKTLLEQFPLTAKYIYFDNSATGLTPRIVLDSQQRYYENYCVNIERGNYLLAQAAAREYETSRTKTAKFLLNCLPEEFIFTRNFTESANLTAYALEQPLLDRGNSKQFSFQKKIIAWKRNDQIVCTVMEHHSNFLPWMRMAKHLGLELKFVYPNQEGLLSPDNFIAAVNNKTRFAAFQHISNAFGAIQPVKDIIRAIKKKAPQALIFIDGAQAAGHMPVDFPDLGCDFYAFSGHKGPLGPKGTGGLVVRKDLLDIFHPLFIGGGTVLDVTLSDYKLKDDYQRFDGGTPNIPGLIGLGKAAEYLSQNIGLKEISKHERRLIKKLLNGMNQINGIEIYGPKNIENRAGIINFNLQGWLCHDLSLVLDDRYKILTRAGHHCCIPAMRFFKLLENYGGNTRVSLHYYNTEKEVDIFLEALQELTD